jgi:hypothetical protein
MDHELLASSDPATCDGAVSRAVEALGLARHASDPDSIHVTVHEDADRVGRVVFVINASGEATLARVSMADASWRDVLDGDATTSRDGVLEIHMRPWSVRMLARS